jgi:hypothetical protein
MVPKPASQQCLNPRVLVFAHVALPDLPIDILAIWPVALAEIFMQRDAQSSGHDKES